MWWSRAHTDQEEKKGQKKKDEPHGKEVLLNQQFSTVKGYNQGKKKKKKKKKERVLTDRLTGEIAIRAEVVPKALFNL